MSPKPRPLSPALATPIERRERRPVNLPGHAVRADGTTAEITVVDLSYEGCGIECREELKPGEKLKLGVVRRGAILANVRWYDSGRAGLVFEPEPETQTDDGPLPRQSERLVVTADVSVRRLGRQSYRVQVFDASMHGCKVEFVDRPQKTERIWIKFDGLEALQARVCWVDQQCAGLEFSRPIHPAVFELVAERMR